MFRIDDATAASSLPVPEAAATPGYFTGGNPLTGTPATRVRASWLNMIQEEIANVITAAGIAFSKTTYNQLLAAIRILIQQQTGNYAADTGAANAYVIAPVPAVSAPVDGQVFRWKPANSSTGASTLAVGTYPAKPLLREDGSAIRNLDVPGGGMVESIYELATDSYYLQGTPTAAAITQSGGVTAGHIATWTATGVIQDGGALGAAASKNLAGNIADNGSGSLGVIAGGITNAMVANMAANTVKANATAGSAAPTDVALAASQLLGRGSSGNIAAIGLDPTLSMSGTTLAATAATTSQAGVSALAATSDVNTGSSTTKSVTPAALAGSKRSCSAAISYIGNTGAIGNSFNVASATYSGSNVTVNFTNAMPNSTYAVVFGAPDLSYMLSVNNANRATGSMLIASSNTNSGGGYASASYCSAVVFGN